MCGMGVPPMDHGQEARASIRTANDREPRLILRRPEDLTVLTDDR